MRRGQDIAVQFPGLYLVHHNLPGKKVDFHRHPEHLVFFPLQGEIKVILREGTLTASPGSAVYLPGNTEHAFDSSSQLGERLIAMLADKTWNKAASGEFLPVVVPASQLAKELLFYLLLHQETRHAKSLIETFVHTVSENLESAASVAEMAHVEGRVKDARIRKVLEELRENLAETISLPQVAARNGLSVRTLNRLFVAELGASPKQILTRYRIERAQELLVSGTANVTDAAFSVGYGSLAQFIRAFRELTGQLPSDVARRGRK